MALDLTYADIFKRVAESLGLGFSAVSAVGTDDKTRIDSYIQDGLRQFYFRAVLPNESSPHQWSFLHPAATITLLTNDYDYALPTDFARVQGSTLSWAVGENNRPLVRISEERLRHLLGHDNTAGLPQYFAVRALTTSSPDSKTSHELLVYPRPSATYNSKVLTYRYHLEPSHLGGTLGNDDDEYPLGGAVHADTVLASCLAIAELNDSHARGPRWEQYQERLAASVAFDRDLSASMQMDTYPIETAPTALDLGYTDFCREVGSRLGYGMEQGVWNHTQNAVVDQLVHRGYRRFLSPNPADGIRYSWSFLKPIGTITTNTTGTAVVSGAYNGAGDYTIVNLSGLTGSIGDWTVERDFVFDTSGNDYPVQSVQSSTQVRVTGDATGEAASDTFTIAGCETQTLPTDFAYFIDEPVFSQDEQVFASWLEEVGEGVIRGKWARCPSYAPPQKIARRYKTSTGTARQTQEALFWPIPIAEHVLTYRYQAAPSRLTTAAPYALGDPMHGETILAACLVEAVRHLHASRQATSEDLAIAEAHYAERLQASIMLDRRLDTPQRLGSVHRRSRDGNPAGNTTATIFHNGVEI